MRAVGVGRLSIGCRSDVDRLLVTVCGSRVWDRRRCTFITVKSRGRIVADMAMPSHRMIARARTAHLADRDVHGCGVGGRIVMVSAGIGAGHDGIARELAVRLGRRGFEVEVVDFSICFRGRWGRRSVRPMPGSCPRLR